MKRAGLLLIFCFAACAANTPSATTAAKTKANSSLAGLIQYPDEAIPAMRVCAFNT